MTATPNSNGAGAITVDNTCAILENENPKNVTWAHYGCPGGAVGVGISFTHTYTMPVNGSFQWVQIANSVSLTATPVVGPAQSLQPSPCVGLDTNYPYNGVYSNPASDSSNNTALVGYSSYQRSDDFTMTLMYQPSLPSSIWVPIASVDWTWGYGATSNDGGNTWTVGFRSWPGSPVAGATTSFPIWTSNAGQCHF